jgi:hypothetical protein
MGSDKLQRLKFCDNCILGKHHRVASKKEEGKQRIVKFWSGMHYSSRLFEYFPSNIWDLIRAKTHEYGFSRRVWVHILKNKSDTFEKFKEWHTLVGN